MAGIKKLNPDAITLMKPDWLYAAVLCRFCRPRARVLAILRQGPRATKTVPERLPLIKCIKPTVDKPVQLSTPVSLCQHMPCPPIHLPLLQFGSISAPPLGAPALVPAAPGCTRPHSVPGYSFNLLSFIRYPCLHCILVMPSLQTECVPTSSNQRRRPCILLMCSIHPPGASKAQRTGSNLQVLHRP